MKIGSWLILLFVGLTLITTAFVALLTTHGARTALREAIGESYEEHASHGASSIATLLREHIREAEQLARRQEVLATLRAANRAYEGKREADISARILALDEEWIAARGRNAAAAKLRDSELSDFLKEWTAVEPRRYGEVFVTDQRGALAGATGSPSDYYQADEQWWAEALAGGRGAAFLDDRGYDESTKTLIIGVAVPVRDGDSIIGVLKANYNLDALFALPFAGRLHEDGRTFLVRGNGQVIASAGAEAAPVVRAPELAAMRAGRAGWGEGEGSTGLRLRAFAPVPLVLHARTPAAGSRPGISGERWEPARWYVFVDVQSGTAFAPVAALQRLAVALVAVALLMAWLVAAAMARSVSRPLRLLRDGAEKIAGGDLGQRLEVESEDEIGEVADAFNKMADALQTQMATLRESEERFRLLTNDVKDYAIIMLDPQGHVYTWNMGAQRLKGYDWKDIIGQPISRFYTPEDLAAGKPAALLKQAETKGRAEDEGWRVRKDGTRFFADVVITALRDKAGELIGFAKITRDITARKQAEEALLQLNKELDQRVQRRTAELLRVTDSMREALDMLDATLDGAFIFDAKTLRFSYVNKGAIQQVGYSREELLEMTPVDIKPEFDEQKFRTTIAPLIKGEQPLLHFETIHRHKDGHDIPVEINLQHVAGGRERGRMIAIVRDISERKQAETALIESETKLRQITSAAREGIVMVDDEGQIKFWNPAAERLFGYSAEEVLGRDIHALITPPQYREQAGHGMASFRTTGQGPVVNKVVELPGQRKDGSLFPLELSVAATRIEGKWQAVGIVRDISERKQAEEERHQLTMRLAASNQELERFAYVASHDLQEPLRTVASYLQLVERRYQDRLDDDGREFIGFAVDGANRMQGMIRDLLEYSRVGTQGKPLAAVGLNGVLAEVLADLGHAIEENAATVTHDALPVVSGDAGQLRRLLQNLIGNAIKYRGEAAPRIHVSAVRIEDSPVRRPEDAPAKGWLLSVKDNGIGIEAQYFEKVFQLFQRLHSRGHYPGTGLGLALCKRIAERHGGAMWVESTPGDGSTFYVALPTEVGT
jgi:PAS domain S-box-containing protein